MTATAAVIRAEWVKLLSTKGFAASALLLTAISVGYALLLGNWKNQPQPDAMPVYVDNWMAIGGLVGGQGLPGVGLAVFMVLGALSVTGEYRTGLIELTYAATPRRGRVLMAKAVTSAIAAAAVAFVLTIVSEYVLKHTLHGNGQRLGFGGDLRPLAVVPLAIVVAVVFAVGIGALVRNSAGAVSLILVWVSGVENVTLFAGDHTGATIRKFLPFANEQNVISNGVGALAWPNTWFSAAVFACWSIGFAVLGISVAMRRDI